MSSLTDFLFPAPAPRGVWAILTWWERRRLPYNAVVGCAGLVSLVVVRIGTAIFEGKAAGPPWQVVVVFGCLANVFYFLGPGIELVAHRLWGRSLLPVGPALYRMGLTFSVGLALLPCLMAMVWVVARAFTAIL